MKLLHNTGGDRARRVRIAVVILVAAAALGGSVSPGAPLGIHSLVAACQGGTGAGG
jgi:hypothetical protein